MQNSPVKIRYVASVRKDNKIGSSLIAWGTKNLHPELEPCSHLAIIVRDTLVIESTLTTGVRIMPYGEWLRVNKIVYEFEKFYEGKLTEYLPSILDKMWGRSYDYLGVLYFAYRVCLFKFFRIRLPIKNKWESPTRRFCVEIFGEKLAMMSPIQMVAYWKNDSSVKEIL